MPLNIREIINTNCIYCRGTLNNQEQDLRSHKNCADLIATVRSENPIIEKFFAKIINFDYDQDTDTIYQAENIQIHDAICEFPKEFNQISFTKLIINYQSNSMPEGLINHPTLTKLILRQVPSYDSAKWVSELPNLEELSLIIRERFDYSKLFSHIIELQNLQRFTFRGENIGDNVTLHEYPQILQRLVNLRELNISNVNLMKIPNDSVFPSNLERLNLNNNNIANIGGVKNILPQLKDLNVSNNKIKDGSFLQYGQDLETVDLGYNNIKKLPIHISNLNNLSKVVLQNNLLTEIPISINSWSELFMLKLAGNKLREVPNLLELQKLRVLDLKSNIIKEIKDNIPSVRIIYLDDNLITKIPKFLTNSGVRHLSLANNKIRRISDFIEDFGVRIRIFLEGNPLDNHSKEMITKLNEEGYKIQF